MYHNIISVIHFFKRGKAFTMILFHLLLNNYDMRVFSQNGVSSVQKMRRLVAETGSSHNNKHYIIWLSSIFPSIFDQMRWFWAWFTAYQSFIALFSPKPILYINSWNFLWSQIEAMSFISERSTVAAVTRRISFTRRKWCMHAWNGSGLL